MTRPGEEITLVSEDGSATALSETCQDLLSKSQFLDVTLSCIDGQVQAHRLVLCSVSSYLYELFTGNPNMNPCTHPMVILRDCKVAEVQLALQYIYAGRTKISVDKLGALLNAARELGCNSLENSVNRALRPIRTSVTPPKPTLHLPIPSGSGLPSLLSQITKAITIKTEPKDEEEEFQGQGLTARVKTQKRSSRSPSPSCSSKGSVPPMPKLLRMAPTGNWKGNRIKEESSTSGDMDPASPPILTRMTEDSPAGPEEAPNSDSKGQVVLQHDKAESFVYTNENLNMLFGDEDGDDPNESDENEESTNSQIKIEPKQEKPSACPWCSQLFSSVVLLQRHIKTHVGNPTGSSKPYTCPYCTHEFARSAHLKRHVRTHTGEKPYKCEYCDREFSRQDKMKTHISRHIQGNLPPASHSNNDSLLRSSYPPASMSQNTGGQVPIKIIIPINSQGPSTSSASANPINGPSPPHPEVSPSLSPSSFFNDRHGPSITINAVTPKQTAATQQVKRTVTQLNSVAN